MAAKGNNLYAVCDNIKRTKPDVRVTEALAILDMIVTCTTNCIRSFVKFARIYVVHSTKFALFIAQHGEGNFRVLYDSSALFKQGNKIRPQKITPIAITLIDYYL
ncbi:unnamed protein product [Leptidea sinapis]|uniref:Uncharacterized protein n=1 Tax=Leptidea sinapis TaxID=189913 RepID=A0A5E4R615_9NEOP|nr:unnamed protein product [Leptidea sinapis]